MQYLGIILASIIAYFIGSISWSIIIVRWRRGVDVRTTGSGNAGATNTTRLLGKWWGLAVVVLDALKVVLAAFIAVLLSLIPSKLFGQTSYFIPALFVLIGHCWPIYYKFKGGKAVACFLGLLFIINIWYLLIFLAVWFLTIAISRRVSVASIAAAIVVGIIIWLPWIAGVNGFIWEWNGFDHFYSGYNSTYWGWQNEWLRFSWMNYLHSPIHSFTETKGLISQPFASGMLEGQIVIMIGALILLARHLPNMKRIVKDEEPETFPKLTEEEKQKMYALQHQPKPTKEQRQALKEFEQRQKYEQEINKLNKKITKSESKLN